MKDKNRNLTIFTMSDATGHTAESVAMAAVKQFRDSNIEIYQEGLPRIVNKQQIFPIMEALQSYKPCIVCYSLVVPKFRETVKLAAEKYNIPVVDIVTPLIDCISGQLNISPKGESGLRLLALDDNYYKRIEAMEFAIKYDDGKDTKAILKADLVVIGVSRTSKTPTCMYLAQNKGLKTLNIPLIFGVEPPKELFEIPAENIIGLSIDPEILHEIRTARLKTLGLGVNSDYANYEKIESELDYARNLMKKLNCSIVDVSRKAIEETASDISAILSNQNIQKNKFKK